MSSEPEIATPALVDPAITTIYTGERASVRHLRKSKLVVVSGPDLGLEFEVGKPHVTGGRSIINDLVLQDKAVSGAHFEVLVRDDGYRLRDLDSRNGTFVGDVRVREVFLRPGMQFRIGQSEIRFQTLQDVVEIALSDKDRFDKVLGATASMREIFATLEKVAQSELTVMITGETGTGKELVARGLHGASPRRDKPFVVLDCGAIPRDLIESTLFGHEKGSFTGAVGQHRGCFEQASGGTIFLDEIGELDIALQPKLLRVLEQREIKRVGGDRTIKVDVRVAAATNRDLRAMVNAGLFREDLYFRLSVILVEIPPLRERREDISLLAQHFLSEITARRSLSLAFDKDALVALANHAWPGNVRELRNVVERVSSLSPGPVLVRSDLSLGRDTPVSLAAHNGAQGRDATAFGSSSVPELHLQGDFKQAKQRVVDDFEVAYLRRLLGRHEGNITRSAQEAGLTRYHLRELLKRHGLTTSGAE
jgi:transcriptional regulator with GAF, ATPase, and Fis domain